MLHLTLFQVKIRKLICLDPWKGPNMKNKAYSSKVRYEKPIVLLLCLSKADDTTRCLKSVQGRHSDIILVRWQSAPQIPRHSTYKENGNLIYVRQFVPYFLWTLQISTRRPPNLLTFLSNLNNKYTRYGQTKLSLALHWCASWSEEIGVKSDILRQLDS